MAQQVTLKLWPIIGINVYQLPIPEMVEQLKHQANDEEYPEELYKALVKQKSQDTVSGGRSSSSDTLSTNSPEPIHDRGSNVISLF